MAIAVPIKHVCQAAVVCVLISYKSTFVATSLWQVIWKPHQDGCQHGVKQMSSWEVEWDREREKGSVCVWLCLSETRSTGTLLIRAAAFEMQLEQIDKQIHKYIQINRYIFIHTYVSMYVYMSPLVCPQQHVNPSALSSPRTLSLTLARSPSCSFTRCQLNALHVAGNCKCMK